VTEGPLTRLARALLLAAAAVVLVALVAVSAGGYRLGDSGSARPSPYAVDTILTVLIGLYLIGAAVVIVAMFWSGLELRRLRSRSRGTRRQRTIRSMLIFVGVVIALAVAAARFHFYVQPRPPDERSGGANGAQTRGHNGSHQKASQHQQIRLVPLFAVLGTAALAAAAFVAAERRRRRRLPRDWVVAEALSDILDETLDDLRAEPDPRRAVIGAYVRMERSLAAHGIPRHRFEAPHEYLGRVFGELAAGRLSAIRLTGLFERARFSPHEIDEAMKATAIEAIEALQADLAAAEAEAAAASEAAAA
jgi:membrane protease YdiL (CAAX protease family)